MGRCLTTPTQPLLKIMLKNHCQISDQYTYQGMRVLFLENRYFRIGLLVDKGSDIFQLIYKPLDIDLMWQSPIGWRKPNSFLPTTQDSISSFMDSFGGGWQECFPSGGPYTHYAGTSIGLHGEITLLPWQYQIIANGPEKAQVELTVQTIRTPFLVKKTLTIYADQPFFQIDEAITNRGGQTLPYMWGHHPAIGSPFLSADCRIDVPARTCETVDPAQDLEDSEFGAGQRFDWPRLKNNQNRLIDGRIVKSGESHTHDLLFLKDLTEGWWAITNQKLRLGISFLFDRKVFPYVWFWRQFGGGLGYPWYRRAYTVALEPWTSYPNQGVETAVKNQTAPFLEAGQTISTRLEITLYEGYQHVKQVKSGGTICGQT